MFADYLCQVLYVLLLSHDLAYALYSLIKKRHNRTLCTRLSTRTYHKAPKLTQALIYALYRHTMTFHQHPYHHRSRILIPSLLFRTGTISKPLQESFRIKIQRRLKFWQVFQQKLLVRIALCVGLVGGKRA